MRVRHRSPSGKIGLDDWNADHIIEGDTSGPHRHPIAEVDGLQPALDAKQPVGSYAPLLHTHNYAAASHGHPEYQPVGNYALANHTHPGSASSDRARPEDFGAVGDGVTDDGDALQRWLDSGAALWLPYTDHTRWFYSEQPLILRCHASLLGAVPFGNDSRPLGLSGHQYCPGSRIVFAPGVAGLDIQTSTTLDIPSEVLALGPAAMTQQGAFNSAIENIGLVGLGGASATGIYLRTYAHFGNVRVVGFSGKGWDLSASSDGDGSDATYGNLSHSSLTNCSAEQCGSHGLHLRGMDANTCSVANFNAHLNSGWGIIDESYGNNKFDIPHFAHNTLGAIKTRETQPDTLIAPYYEPGNGNNTDLGGNTVVLGSDAHAINAAGNPTSVSGARVRSKLVEAVGPGAPLVADSTNGNGPKIALKNNGVVQAYLGTVAGEFAVFDAQANPLGGFAPASHTHDYAASDHNHAGVYQPFGSYATSVHNHGISEVTGLQAALDGKQASGSYALASHAHSDATTSASGYMSAADKAKLDGLSQGGGGALTNASAALAADVQLPTSNTYVNGPSLTLAAGTWLVMGTATFQRNATTAVHWLARLSDGTTHYASSQTYQGSVSGHTASLSLKAIITLAAQTTIRLQGATSVGATTALMKAATPAAGSGNNATNIIAVKIA
jgi:hypothetical protein